MNLWCIEYSQPYIWRGRTVRNFIYYFVVSLALHTSACVGEGSTSGSYFAGYTPFDLNSRSEFSDYDQVVGSYLRRAAPGRDTHACVIGLSKKERDTDAVWVIWREGDRFIRWFPRENNLETSSRNLSLTADVVPTDADVGTSTYLESRPWVDELERLCAEHGRRVSASQ